MGVGDWVFNGFLIEIFYFYYYKRVVVHFFCSVYVFLGFGLLLVTFGLLSTFT